MEKIFCKFLSNIGIIDKDTYSTFLQIYNDIINDNKYINIYELSFHILMTFLNNISNKQKEFLCQNLPIKYFQLRQNIILGKLRSIIITNQLKYKMHLVKYLYIWKNSKKSKMNKSNNHNAFIFNRNSSIKSSNTAYQIHRQKNLFEKDNKDFFWDKNEIFNFSTKSGFNNNFISNNTTAKNSNSHINFNFTNVNSKGECNKSNSGSNSTYKKRINKSFNNSKIVHDIKKTLEYKEEKELKECTFKPKINNLKQSLNNTATKEKSKEIQNVFEKLYKDNEKYKLSKQVKALELDYLMNKDLTFNPTINNSKHLTKENSKENFETRIKTFLEQKKQHSEEMKKKINKEFEENFSFTPKINTSKISKNNSTNSLFTKTFNEKNGLENYRELPAYIRLYQESQLRNQKQIQKRKEADDLITNLSNSNIKSTILDFNKIKELHENKNRSKIEEKTKNKVNKEEGITFKPSLYKNKFAKNIFSNFYERNTKFLEDREKFITSEKNKMNIGKVISTKEKKQIVKNVIGRLYSDPKSFSLTNSGCNRYIKSIKGNWNKKLNINNFNYEDN